MASKSIVIASVSSKDEEQEKRALMMEKIDMGAVLEAKEVYDAVMQSFPTTLGKSVSKKERDELGLKDASLVYGEITFETFAVVVEKIKKVYGLPFANSCGPAGMLQSRGGIFYDLGSGTGKPVIAAAICHNFDVCYGIEVLEGLYSMSLDAMNIYNTKGKARLSGRSTDTRKWTSGAIHCQSPLDLHASSPLSAVTRYSNDTRRLFKVANKGLAGC